MKVTIGLPMYQGTGGLTLRSLLSLQAALLARGDEPLPDIVTGGSIITKVRNSIARRFMESGNDYLIFIDADMVFDAADILRLLDAGKDISAINYMSRKPGAKWLGRPARDEDGKIQREGKWIKTEAAGTGLMCISQAAMQRMAEAYQDCTYADDGPTIALFDFAIINGKYTGEDYLFCKRWRDIGGEIWTMADVTVGHMGETAYVGNYHDYLDRQ